MSLWKFIRSKLFLWQIVISIVVFFLLMATVMWSLGFYTRHGRTIIVPQLTGFQEKEIVEAMENIGLSYTIIDSLHRSNAVPGEIIDQVPKAGQYVKKGRMIFLTINAFNCEMVTVPKLVDYSLRNAQVVLESRGLRMGQVIYKPSEYTDLVLSQLIDEHQVREGARVPKGTEISLVVGNGLGSKVEVVPDLLGLTISEARQTVAGVGFSIGSVICDETVRTSRDSALAVVWKQSPDAVDGAMEKIGASINIWITNNMDAVMNGLSQPAE